MHGFGDADLAAHRPLTAADHFRVGSNTKTFVISVLLQLVDEGKLGLNDPISHFSLGVTIPNAENITVAELCQMRSGLFEAFNSPEFDNLKLEPDMKFDPRTIIGWAMKQKPYFAPGKGYRYGEHQLPDSRIADREHHQGTGRRADPQAHPGALPPDPDELSRHPGNA